MSAEAHGAPVAQPESFEFSPENLEKAKAHIAKYPKGRQASAVLPLLDLAQRQCGNWLPRAAMDTVAHMLELAPIRVYEIATFYSMFNLRPVGKPAPPRPRRPEAFISLMIQSRPLSMMALVPSQAPRRRAPSRPQS